MISHKFAALTALRIADFLESPGTHAEADMILDSVVSISDLWVLANMKRCYDEKFTEDGCIGGDFSGVFLSLRGGDAPCRGDRIG